MQLSTVPTFVDGELGPRHVDLRPVRGQRRQPGLGAARRPDPGRPGQGRADRELLARRRLQGHLGARRADRTAGRAVPHEPSSPSRRPEPPGTSGHRRAGQRMPRRPAIADPPRAGSEQQQQGPARRGEEAPMLSRIAESMFWIGRYVERAEDTARILDVQTQLMLEDATIDEETTCRGLLSIMGVEDAPEPRSTSRYVLSSAGLRPGLAGLDRLGPRPPPARARGGPARRCRCRCGRRSTPPTARIPSGQFARPAAARRLPVGARAGGADQRHRRRHDDPRRGLALPDARPLRRARRHDLAAGGHARR